MGSNYAPYIGKSLYNSTLRLAVFGMLIISSFFLFNACNKEALIDDENPSDLISYNWGEKERNFFNFSNVSSLFEEKVGLSYRNTSDTLPQLLVDAYNQLALENETHNFAERLSARIGVPFWSYSYVNVDESIEGGLIITPIGFVEGNKTTALLIASKSKQYPDNKFDFKLVLRKDIEKTIRDQNFTERPNLILEIGHLIYDDINIYNTFDNNFMDFLSANKAKLKNIYNANKLSYRDCVIYKFEHCFGIVVPYGENIEGSNNEGDTSGSVDWGGFGWRQDNNGGWTIPDKPGGEGVITPYIENFWKTFFDLYIRNLWQPNMVIERKDVQNKDNKTKLNSQQDKINLRGGNEDCWIFYIKKCSNENGLFEEVLMDEQEQCEMALENFSYQYNLTLSQAEIDYLQQNIPSYFCYESKEYNQAAISLYLKYNLNLNCDINTTFNIEAQKIIFGLLKNNHLGGDFGVENRTTSAILSDIINSNCGSLNQTEDDFYNSFSEYMAGDPIDWKTATDQQKIDKIMGLFRIYNYPARCTGKESKIPIKNYFKNFPEATWGSNNILTGKVLDRHNKNYFDITLIINFDQLPNNCLRGIPPPAYMNGPNPRSINNGQNYALNYTRCALNSYEDIGNISSAFEIVYPKIYDEIYQYYYVFAYDVLCPKK